MDYSINRYNVDNNVIKYVVNVSNIINVGVNVCIFNSKIHKKVKNKVM